MSNQRRSVPTHHDKSLRLRWAEPQKNVRKARSKRYLHHLPLPTPYVLSDIEDSAAPGPTLSSSTTAQGHPNPVDRGHCHSAKLDHRWRKEAARKGEMTIQDR
eukprot:202504-Rhodomonas_salina.1